MDSQWRVWLERVSNRQIALTQQYDLHYCHNPEALKTKTLHFKVLEFKIQRPKILKGLLQEWGHGACIAWSEGHNHKLGPKGPEA